MIPLSFGLVFVLFKKPKAELALCNLKLMRFSLSAAENFSFFSVYLPAFSKALALSAKGFLISVASVVANSLSGNIDRPSHRPRLM